MKPLPLVVLLLACISISSAQVVAVDGFHNDETKMPDHYRWEGVRAGGYSELGKVITGLGGELRTVHERLTPAVLAPLHVLIIADPDTPDESDDPKYIESSEIEALDLWVQSGGALVLFGNDKGNAEFQHFNELARRFGIQFVEDSYPPKVAGKGILRARGAGSIFEEGLSVYMVEVAPLRVNSNVQVLLRDGETVIMALANRGRGLVFAVGDPWVYNEYIDRADNRKVAENLFRLLLKQR